MSKNLRLAADGTNLVCTSCHKLSKFCKCGPDKIPNCPICHKPLGTRKHFPKIDCSGTLDNYEPKS